MSTDRDQQREVTQEGACEAKTPPPALMGREEAPDSIQDRAQRQAEVIGGLDGLGRRSRRGARAQASVMDQPPPQPLRTFNPSLADMALTSFGVDLSDIEVEVTEMLATHGKKGAARGGHWVGVAPGEESNLEVMLHELSHGAQGRGGSPTSFDAPSYQVSVEEEAMLAAQAALRGERIKIQHRVGDELLFDEEQPAPPTGELREVQLEGLPELGGNNVIVTSEGLVGVRLSWLHETCGVDPASQPIHNAQLFRLVAEGYLVAQGRAVDEAIVGQFASTPGISLSGISKVAGREDVGAFQMNASLGLYLGLPKGTAALWVLQDGLAGCLVDASALDRLGGAGRDVLGAGTPRLRDVPGLRGFMYAELVARFGGEEGETARQGFEALAPEGVESSALTLQATYVLEDLDALFGDQEAWWAFMSQRGGRGQLVPPEGYQIAADVRRDAWTREQVAEFLRETSAGEHLGGGGGGREVSAALAAMICEIMGDPALKARVIELLREGAQDPRARTGPGEDRGMEELVRDARVIALMEYFGLEPPEIDNSEVAGEGSARFTGPPRGKVFLGHARVFAEQATELRVELEHPEGVLATPSMRVQWVAEVIEVSEHNPALQAGEIEVGEVLQLGVQDGAELDLGWLEYAFATYGRYRLRAFVEHEHYPAVAELTREIEVEPALEGMTFIEGFEGVKGYLREEVAGPKELWDYFQKYKASELAVFILGEAHDNIPGLAELLLVSKKVPWLGEVLEYLSKPENLEGVLDAAFFVALIKAGLLAHLTRTVLCLGALSQVSPELFGEVIRVLDKQAVEAMINGMRTLAVPPLQKALEYAWPVGQGVSGQLDLSGTLGFPEAGVDCYVKIVRPDPRTINFYGRGAFYAGVGAGVGAGVTTGRRDGSERGGAAYAAAEAGAGLRLIYVQEFDFPFLEDDAFIGLIATILQVDEGVMVLKALFDALKPVDPLKWLTKSKIEGRVEGRASAGAQAELNEQSEGARAGRHDWNRDEGKPSDLGSQSWVQRLLGLSTQMWFQTLVSVGGGVEINDLKTDEEGKPLTDTAELVAFGDVNVMVGLSVNFPLVGPILNALLPNRAEVGVGFKIKYRLVGLEAGEPRIDESQWPKLALIIKSGEMDLYQGPASETELEFQIPEVTANEQLELDMATLKQSLTSMTIQKRIQLFGPLGYKYNQALGLQEVFSTKLGLDYNEGATSKKISAAAEAYIDLTFAFDERATGELIDLLTEALGGDAGGVAVDEVLRYLKTGQEPSNVAVLEALYKLIVSRLQKVLVHLGVGFSRAAGGRVGAGAQLRGHAMGAGLYVFEYDVTELAREKLEAMDVATSNALVRDTMAGRGAGAGTSAGEVAQEGAEAGADEAEEVREPGPYGIP